MNKTITEYKKEDIIHSLKVRQDLHRIHAHKYFFNFNVEIGNYLKTLYPDLRQRIETAFKHKNNDYIKALQRKLEKEALKKFNALMWRDNIFYPVSYLEIYLEEKDFVERRIRDLEFENYYDKALKEFEMRKG
jgi:hypothetical protein